MEAGAVGDLGPHCPDRLACRNLFQVAAQLRGLGLILKGVRFDHMRKQQVGGVFGLRL